MTVGLASLPDSELVGRIAAGDEAALAAAYDRHVDVVYGSVVRFIGDREAGEEIVQDTFVALWQHASRFDPAAGSLLGWLLRISRNRAIDRFRAAARRPRTTWLPSTEGGPDGPPRGLREAGTSLVGDPVADGPDELAERSWTRAVVRAAISDMPEPERHALELAYFEELTQVEIADRLGWPLGTVKTRTRRALASLRHALEGVPELTDGPSATATGGM